MEKINMITPIVEMDGDEMTRILWRFIKDELIKPYVKLQTEYYDLGLPNRNKTDDAVTVQAAEAIKRLRVGVKCATITPNAQRMEEYDLKRMYKSPNATIRAALDGTVFRAPIVAEGIQPLVANWKEPITIARHAYGDIYKCVETKAGSGVQVQLVCGDEAQEVHAFDGDGVAMAMHNTDASIRSFAKACFAYALSVKQDLWFGAKDTIAKVYDGRFKDIFAEVFEEYRDAFENAGIAYEYSLIDDIVARVMRSRGGFIWACKNYDGDVMSDMMAASFGSLAMMTSVLVSPDGNYEYEAAHGTVTRHYYKHLRGETTSTNPVATIFAWTGALRQRGAMDENLPLQQFADRMEKAVLNTIAAGKMTGDLAAITTLQNKETLSTKAFISAVRATYESMEG